MLAMLPMERNTGDRVANTVPISRNATIVASCGAKRCRRAAGVVSLIPDSSLHVPGVAFGDHADRDLVAGLDRFTGQLVERRLRGQAAVLARKLCCGAGDPAFLDAFDDRMVRVDSREHDVAPACLAQCI